ncbi:unnamed protein product [Brassica rapa subsp. trilocularis]
MWQNSSARCFNVPKGKGLEDGEQFASSDHFTAPLYHIKINASIESLINREYMERDKSNPQIYDYLA